MFWKEDAPQELENKMDELDLSKITNAKSNDMGEAVADNDLYDSREERDSQRDDMSRLEHPMFNDGIHPEDLEQLFKDQPHLM